MKIIEILEQYDTRRSERRRERPYDYDQLNSLRGRKSAASGWYSRAVPHPQDPHTFIKSTKLTSHLHDDAFHKYMEMVVGLHKRGIDNPYFPAVYEMKITRDPAGNTRPQYHLQALQQHTDYDVEALRGMAERMFKDPELIVTDQDGVNSAWGNICRVLKYAVEDQNFKHLKDPDLIRALKYIQALMQKNKGWDLDMHSGNFLIRGTSTGPQLVITDPVSDSGRSIPSPSDLDPPTEKFTKKAEKKRGITKPEQLYKVLMYDPRGSGLFYVGSFRAANNHHAEAKHAELRRTKKLPIPTVPHTNELYSTFFEPAELADQLLKRHGLGAVPPPPPRPTLSSVLRQRLAQNNEPELRMGSGGTGLSKKPSWFDDLS